MAIATGSPLFITGGVVSMQDARFKYPLWWCLPVAAQAALMQWQWDNYGLHLSFPPRPGEIYVPPHVESVEEIDWLMRQKPHPGHPRRVK
ncbi:hypothetical protein ES708_28848 [subsurface metagenome]